MKSYKKNLENMKNILKIWKKSWEPFGSYLLNSTANAARCHLFWAGLALLFSRQLLNGSQDFFSPFNMSIFIYFFKYKTIETHAGVFLQLNISAVGSVTYNQFGIIRVLQRSPIPQTSNWSGIFFLLFLTANQLYQHGLISNIPNNPKKTTKLTH